MKLQCEPAIQEINISADSWRYPINVPAPLDIDIKNYPEERKQIN